MEPYCTTTFLSWSLRSLKLSPSLAQNSLWLPVESMEGTDATIERAGALLGTLEADGEASTLERRLSVVKVAKPAQDMRFDVPVIGSNTIETMRRAGATCLSIEAGRTLIFDLDTIRQLAAAAGIAIIAV